MKGNLATSIPLAPRDLSGERRAARARFNEMFHDHLRAKARSGLTLVTAWAKALGVSEQLIRRNGDPLHVTGVLAAGDLEALPAVDLVPLLERWLEHALGRLAPTTPARDPWLIALTSTSRAGDIAKAVRRALSKKSPGGERCISVEWREIEKECAEGEREMREAKLAARAAAEAQERAGGSR